VRRVGELLAHNGIITAWFYSACVKVFVLNRSEATSKRFMREREKEREGERELRRATFNLLAPEFFFNFSTPVYKV
jgi:hypothetical protein